MNIYYFSKKTNLYTFWVTDPLACKLINNKLNVYPKRYRDEDTETYIQVSLNEAIFKVSQNDMKWIKSLCTSNGGIELLSNRVL